MLFTARKALKLQKKSNSTKIRHKCRLPFFYNKVQVAGGRDGTEQVTAMLTLFPEV